MINPTLSSRDLGLSTAHRDRMRMNAESRIGGNNEQIKNHVTQKQLGLCKSHIDISIVDYLGTPGYYVH